MHAELLVSVPKAYLYFQSSSVRQVNRFHSNGNQAYILTQALPRPDTFRRTPILFACHSFFLWLLYNRFVLEENDTVIDIDAILRLMMCVSLWRPYLPLKLPSLRQQLFSNRLQRE